jgi:hypothetical protein
MKRSQDDRENWMTPILDCLVNYFGLDEDEQPGYRRCFCYHILAGPGPRRDGGVASITTLALHDESERCSSCERLHVAETGGPAAAVAAALRYLDAYHARDHLWKVQSAVRGLDGHAAIEAKPFPEARGRPVPGRGIPTSKG